MPSAYIEEADVSIGAIESILRAFGREILDIQGNEIWIRGNEFSRIQVSLDPEKKALSVFIARPIGVAMTENECLLLANELNYSYSICRFCARFSQADNQFVLFIDHCIFFVGGLNPLHLVQSLTFVEFYGEDCVLPVPNAEHLRPSL